IEPASPALAGGFLTTQSPGKAPSPGLREQPRSHSDAANRGGRCSLGPCTFPFQGTPRKFLETSRPQDVSERPPPAPSPPPPRGL
ncbi:unnamed protein product, partial [Rangifer tarandus platyrhynchus]